MVLRNVTLPVGCAAGVSATDREILSGLGIVSEVASIGAGRWIKHSRLVIGWPLAVCVRRNSGTPTGPQENRQCDEWAHRYFRHWITTFGARRYAQTAQRAAPERDTTVKGAGDLFE
jgi:hypothetical protein